MLMKYLPTQAGIGPAGIALAGGKSRRMGRDKASITLHDGRTWLEHAFLELQSVVNPCFVSCAKGRAYDGFPCLEDEQAEKGPMGGVITALKYCAAHGISAIFVLACDLPLLNRNILSHLLKGYYENGFRYQLTLFQNGQSLKLEPLAAIYSLAALPPLEKSFALGEYSLIKAIPEDCQWRIPYGQDWSKYFINCNTQADYLQATAQVSDF